MLDAPAAYARRRAGIPAQTRPGRPWWKRLLTSKWLWITLIAVVVYAGALLVMYSMMSPDRELPNGEIAYGLNDQALRESAFWAMWTLLAWVVVFVWLDRFRPQRPLIWFLTLGWGACMSTFFSLYVNSWAAEMMSVQGVNPSAGAGPAIFIAPFIEEATKATVLFLLAIGVRYQLISRLNLVALAGLSAAGFAFTENIIYYARTYVYASRVIEAGDPDAYLRSIVWMRGVQTAFAHPLFTAMTAVGVAVALRTRSKIVRVVAPLAGFGAAAGLHMAFNGTVSTTPEDKLLWPYISALVLLASFVALMLLTVVNESRTIRARLTDFVRMGWLEPRDPIVFSGPFKRVKLTFAAMLRGWRTFRDTLALMRLLTELAYLRDATNRGTVHSPAVEREKEILYAVRELRPTALTDTAGLKLVPPRRPRCARLDAPPPAYPGPAGLGGNWPAPDQR